MLRHSRKGIEKLFFLYMMSGNKAEAETINSVVIFKNCYWKVIPYSEAGCVFSCFIFL